VPAPCDREGGGQADHARADDGGIDVDGFHCLLSGGAMRYDHRRPFTRGPFREQPVSGV
jgi:hypothetical protein